MDHFYFKFNFTFNGDTQLRQFDIQTVINNKNCQCFRNNIYIIRNDLFSQYNIYNNIG